METRDLHDIVIGIFGAIIFALLDKLRRSLIETFKIRKFKKLFGFKINEFHLIYGRMVLKPEYANRDRFPYTKQNTNYMFSISSPLSFSEAKCLRYFSECFSISARKTPSIISDDEISDKINLTYCSFGGYNNLKTIEILESSNNRFYIFKLGPDANIQSKANPTKTFVNDGFFDYRLIIKLYNINFPDL